jgi:hypothetical protein
MDRANGHPDCARDCGKCQHAEKPASRGRSGHGTTKPGQRNTCLLADMAAATSSRDHNGGHGKEEERGTLTGVLLYVEVLGEERAQRLHSAPREAHEMGEGHIGTGDRVRDEIAGCHAGSGLVARDCRGTGGVEKAYAKRKCGSLAGRQEPRGSRGVQGQPKAASALCGAVGGVGGMEKGLNRAWDCVGS